MVIRDIKGLYEIKVDENKRIVYQTHFEGAFDKEAMKRLDNDYKTRVIPVFKGKKWAKLCDLRKYCLRDVVEEMNTHNEYCIKNGMAHVAILVTSVIVKMQMNRAGRNVQVPPTAFTEIEEAKKWLKTNGYF